MLTYCKLKCKYCLCSQIERKDAIIENVLPLKKVRIQSLQSKLMEIGYETYSLPFYGKSGNVWSL